MPIWVDNLGIREGEERETSYEKSPPAKHDGGDTPQEKRAGDAEPTKGDTERRVTAGARVTAGPGATVGATVGAGEHARNSTRIVIPI